MSDTNNEGGGEGNTENRGQSQDREDDDTPEEFSTEEALNDVFGSGYQEDSLVDTMDALAGRWEESEKKDEDDEESGEDNGNEDEELERVLSDVFNVDDEFLESIDKIFGD